MPTYNPLLAFLFIYFINLLLDYPLQSVFEATNKSKYNYVLFVHSAIWGLGITFAIIYLQGGIVGWKIVMLVFGHMLMDGWKCRTFTSPDDIKKTFGIKMSGKTAFYIDQSFHVGQIAVALYC